MIIDQERLLILSVPASLLLLGVLLLVCARLLRRQDFLYWCAVGHILPGIALAIQSFMSNAQMAAWSAPTALLYLGGAAAVAHGIALRYGGRIMSQVALGIVAQTLIGLICCSWFVDDIVARMIILNSGLGMLYTMALPQIWRRWRSLGLWDRVIGFSYVMCTGFALGRAVWVGAAAVRSPDAYVGLSQSSEWKMLLAGALLFSMWFAFSLIFASVRDVVVSLYRERDVDPLTGLMNRRAFFERAARRMAADRPGKWYVIGCDIDHFKTINDTWGHDTGDEVLRRVGAELATAAVEWDDLVARFGGEEFILMLRRPNLEEAARTAEALRLRLAGLSVAPMPVAPRGSFGVAELPPGGDLDAALRRADALLYQAKMEGRNRVVIDPALTGVQPGAAQSGDMMEAVAEAAGGSQGRVVHVVRSNGGIRREDGNGLKGGKVA